MGDSPQLVVWALGARCPLRDSPEAERQPVTACRQTGRAHACFEGRRDPSRVFGDVFVSSRRTPPKPGYPHTGFVISREFERLGGLEGLARICRECAANVQAEGVATCAGELDLEPDSPELQTLLDETIAKLGILREVEPAFPVTRPTWYGLWAVSPVPVALLPVLRQLLSGLNDPRLLPCDTYDTFREARIVELSHLIAAVDRAIAGNLSLHVELLPRGHALGGHLSIHPHCPFCRAMMRFKPAGFWRLLWHCFRGNLWLRDGAATVSCHVCGTAYAPRESAWQEFCGLDPRDDLREVLGSQAFREFAVNYLVEQGTYRMEAEDLVDSMESTGDSRHGDDLAARWNDYVDRHVYAGLPCVEAPPEPRGKPVVPTPEGQSSGWFDGDTMGEVLARAERLGLVVFFMHHRSRYGDRDVVDLRRTRIRSPLKQLKRWRAKGCDEKFHVSFMRVDSLLDSDE